MRSPLDSLRQSVCETAIKNSRYGEFEAVFNAIKTYGVISIGDDWYYLNTTTSGPAPLTMGGQTRPPSPEYRKVLLRNGIPESSEYTYRGYFFLQLPQLMDNYVRRCCEHVLALCKEYKISE